MTQGPNLVDEEDLIEALKERDWAQDCLQRTHIALGGDGEWTGKLPPEMPPDSGDLHYDVPALAEEQMRELGRLREKDLRATEFATTLSKYANSGDLAMRINKWLDGTLHSAGPNSSEIERLRKVLALIRAEANDTNSGVSETIRLDRILTLADEGLSGTKVSPGEVGPEQGAV